MFTRQRSSMTRIAASLVLSSAISASAFAHITANPNDAVANTYFQTALTVPHGCDGSSTVAIEVRIPDDVFSVKPQLKPGWTLDMQTRAIDPPLKGEHGKPVTRAVSAITWRGGPLPDSAYDTFGLVMKLPDAPGKTLWFPFVQTCENGKREWTQIPAKGEAWHALESPAPFVRLAPAVASQPMPEMNMPGMQNHGDHDAHASH